MRLVKRQPVVSPTNPDNVVMMVQSAATIIAAAGVAFDQPVVIQSYQGGSGGAFVTDNPAWAGTGKAAKVKMLLGQEQTTLHYPGATPLYFAWVADGAPANLYHFVYPIDEWVRDEGGSGVAYITHALTQHPLASASKADTVALNLRDVANAEGCPVNESAYIDIRLCGNGSSYIAWYISPDAGLSIHATPTLQVGLLLGLRPVTVVLDPQATLWFYYTSLAATQSGVATHALSRAAWLRAQGRD